MRVNPSALAFWKEMQFEGLLGSDGFDRALMPPPLHDEVAMPASSRHLRVRSAPQDLADCAHSSQAVNELRPRAALGLALGTYFFSSWTYWPTAGTWSAARNGVIAVCVKTLLVSSAEPAASTRLWS